jgi:hypothetical protein
MQQNEFASLLLQSVDCKHCFSYLLLQVLSLVKGGLLLLLAVHFCHLFGG